MRLIICISMLFAMGLVGCAATGLREVPTHIEYDVILHVKGSLVSDKSESRPLAGAVVKVTGPNGEVKEYLTSNDGGVSFSISAPTEVHGSSVTHRPQIKEIEISRQGYFTKKELNSSEYGHIFEKRKWYWGNPVTVNIEENIVLSPNYEKKIIVADESNDPISQAKVIAVSNNKIMNRWYTNEDGISNIDLMEAYNYSGECETLVDKDGYMCITHELGYRCFEDDINNLYNVYVKMTNQDDYIRARCCPVLDEYVSEEVSLELGYWLIGMAEKYNMRLDSICIKDYKGKKYLSINLYSSSIKHGNRLSDYDVAKDYFMLLVIDYIKSPSYAKPKNSNLHGFNINLDSDISYVSKSDAVTDKNMYELQYYFSAIDAKKFVEQQISRQQFADKTTTIARGDLIDLILR